MTRNDLYNVAHLSSTPTGALVMRAKPGFSLDFSQIEHFAPTVFAPTAHESRSDRFAYLSTATVLERLILQGFNIVEVKTGGSRDVDKLKHTKHAIRLRKLDNQGARHVGEVRREITVGNAHDGSSAFYVMSSLWRLACLNGLQVSDGPLSEIRINHSGDIADKVIDAAFQVIEHGAEVDRSIDLMKSIQLSVVETLDLADRALSLRFDDDKQIMPSSLLGVRREADRGHDLWRVFNRLQESLIERGGTPYRTRGAKGAVVNRRTRPVTGITENIRLNRELWALAADYARMKA